MRASRWRPGRRPGDGARVRDDATGGRREHRLLACGLTRQRCSCAGGAGVCRCAVLRRSPQAPSRPRCGRARIRGSWRLPAPLARTYYRRVLPLFWRNVRKVSEGPSACRCSLGLEVRAQVIEPGHVEHGRVECSYQTDLVATDSRFDHSHLNRAAGVLADEQRSRVPTIAMSWSKPYEPMTLRPKNLPASSRCPGRRPATSASPVRCPALRARRTGPPRGTACSCMCLSAGGGVDAREAGGDCRTPLGEVLRACRAEPARGRADGADGRVLQHVAGPALGLPGVCLCRQLEVEREDVRGRQLTACQETFVAPRYVLADSVPG